MAADFDPPGTAEIASTLAAVEPGQPVEPKKPVLEPPVGTLVANPPLLPPLPGPSRPPLAVVLSVGGNDLREVLGAPHLIRERIASFHVNYPRILDAVLRVTPRVVLVLQYRPALDKPGGDDYGDEPRQAKQR